MMGFLENCFSIGQVRDFIHSALYDAKHGYFSQRSGSVGVLEKSIKFNQLKGAYSISDFTIGCILLESFFFFFCARVHIVIWVLRNSCVIQEKRLKENKLFCYWVYVIMVNN
jgi:hypothetical protein